MLSIKKSFEAIKKSPLKATLKPIFVNAIHSLEYLGFWRISYPFKSLSPLAPSPRSSSAVFASSGEPMGVHEALSQPDPFQTRVKGESFNVLSLRLKKVPV